ncbi:hypothetical protein [Clostridium drakei]|uniref:Uncharacterized protein n=1 Tax=Clostridium drakei TaxID=332101 RepID=A0A2U8DXH2_9CLOT|nr:hypothetical protein [Clostridium drakei]AWI06752.1 hypothetical protein B9W14_20375 [Clostridium drakei]
MNVRIFAVYNSKRVNEGGKTYHINFVAADAESTEEEIKIVLKEHTDKINIEHARKNRLYVKPVQSLDVANILANFDKKIEEPKLYIIDVADYMDITDFINSKEVIIAAVRSKKVVLGYNDPISLVYDVIHRTKEPEFYDFKMQLVSFLEDISYDEYMAALKNIPYVPGEEYSDVGEWF